MSFILKIGTTQYQSEVEGTGDWSKTVSRDFNDRIFRTKADLKFKGWGALYDILFGNMQDNGVCQSLTGKVYIDTGEGYGQYWTGELKPQDFEFDLLNNSADGQILDNSWASKFNNSNEQKVFLRSTTSKSGVKIRSCDNNLCKFYDPTDSVISNYAYTGRLCFRIFDVFSFLVRYYSDDTVTFQSDFFDIGGDGDQYYITTGQELREGTNWVNPEVSFKEVFDEMNKKCNLWIIIEGTLDAPVLRIEPQSYVFKDEKILEIENPSEIKVSTDLDLLYTIINVGSTQQDFDIDDDANYPNPRYYAWNNESYNTAGDCEFENSTLDLVSTWKIDTNTIEKVLNAGVEDYDDDIFLVEIDPDGVDYDAFKFQTDLTGDDTVSYIYNYNLRNSNVIERWFDGIPQQIVKDLSQEFYVHVDTATAKTVVAGTYEDITFDNDSTPPATDPDDIYTTLLEASGDDNHGEFTVKADGYYKFDISIDVSNPAIDKFLGITAHIYTDNTRGRRISIVNNANSVFATTSGTTTITDTFNLYLLAGQTVVFRIYDARPLVIDQGYDIDDGFCTMTKVNAEYTATNSLPLIYNYTLGMKGLTKSEFELLEQSGGYLLVWDTDTGRSWKLWARELKYKESNGTLETSEFIGNAV